MKKLAFLFIMLSANVFAQNPDSLEFGANPEGFKTSLLKIEFLSPLTGNLTLGYEKYHKNGLSFEGKVGLIGLGFNGENQRGAFLKFGPKFKTSPDYIVKGMKAAHPMKGTYIKPEVLLSFYRKDVYDYGSGSIYPTNETETIKVSAVVFTLNYGRQVILSDKVSVDWYGGLGYGFTSNGNGYNYGAIGGGSGFPIAVTAGLTIGVLLN